MQKSKNLPMLFAVLALAAASLCCNVPGASPTEEITPLPDADACYATPYLSVKSQITTQETNQFGTRLCDYKLEITNANPETAINFYIYQHDADGYQGTEEYRWMGNVRLGVVETGEWQGYVYIYTDPDASGPLMSVPVKIAGVFDEPQCAEEKQDLEYLEEISIPVEAVCPME